MSNSCLPAQMAVNSIGLDNIDVLFDLDRVRSEWLRHCSNSRLDSNIAECINQFFKLPELYVQYGKEGVFIGTIQQQRRRCFLVCQTKLYEVKQALEGSVGIIFPLSSHWGYSHAALSDLQQASISTHNEYFKWKKSIQKFEKELKRQQKFAQLQDQRQKLIDALPQQDLLVFISVDVEWHERNSDAILELGWTLWNNYTRTCWSKHWIVQETIYITNGSYVPNNKHSFLFGKSIIGSLKEGVEHLQHDINHGGLKGPESEEATLYLPATVTSNARVVLVGHGLKMDINMLKGLGIILPHNLEVADTQQLSWARGNGTGTPTPGLSSLLGSLKLKASKLHNAGNDARYTMEALLALLQ